MEFRASHYHCLCCYFASIHCWYRLFLKNTWSLKKRGLISPSKYYDVDIVKLWKLWFVKHVGLKFRVFLWGGPTWIPYSKQFFNLRKEICNHVTMGCDDPLQWFENASLISNSDFCEIRRWFAICWIRANVIPYHPDHTPLIARKHFNSTQ